MILLKTIGKMKIKITGIKNYLMNPKVGMKGQYNWAVPGADWRKFTITEIDEQRIHWVYEDDKSEDAIRKNPYDLCLRSGRIKPIYEMEDNT